jgi:8-oxo-dGTP pyrophosphatase MutT (NUDIX family)
MEVDKRMTNTSLFIKSCGVIAYKNINNVNHYLIIRAINGDVGFPKGRMENGESETETAVRELGEETGVTVDLISDFRAVSEYRFPRKPEIKKQVVYFLGKCVNDKIVIQESEVETAEFLPFDKALKMVSFEQTKSILKDAENFLKK